MICPHCGKDAYLYSKENGRWVVWWNDDGGVDTVTEPVPLYYRSSVPLYCEYCDKRVGTYEKLFPMR